MRHFWINISFNPMKILTSSARIAFALFFLVAGIAAGTSQPLLHPLFSDHAVLQRGKPVPVWGWTTPGTTVTIEFADQRVQTSADENGKWTATLQPMDASDRGRTLKVTTENSSQSAEANDVLVGDVWLCSGQSNMEMGITLCKEDEEIASADHPAIRLLNITKKTAYKPETLIAAEWAPCSPASLRELGQWGGFSATAYFFGKHLHQELGIPIGLIHSSWGGTQAEGWTSAPALAPFPSFHAQLAEVAAIGNSTADDPEQDYLKKWFAKHDPGTRNGWGKTAADTADWREVNLPGTWADCGIPGFEGVVWAQRHIDFPKHWAGRELVIELGEISDNDTTWLNGAVVGDTIGYGIPRTYSVPAEQSKAGRNTLTLRVVNAGGGSILRGEHDLRVYPVGKANDALSLAGSWRLQETAKKTDTGRPLIGNPRVPSVLYNGMIAPLEPFTLAGVIWYQGEANAWSAHQYQRLLPAMIHNWRAKFRNEALPFHIVSLANYQQPHDQPRDSDWAELREAQAMTAKNLPHCGLAVTIDIGDADDIHPTNKRDVGHRLALSALAKVYANPVAGSGPWYRSIQNDGDALRLQFDHTDGGLVFKGATDRSFAVAGEDRKFVWAEARIAADEVVVSSPGVKQPVAVRYAWDINPQACLYNGAGLPAVPFRSDTWPGITEGRD